VAIAAFRSAAKGRDALCYIGPGRENPRRRCEFLFWQWLVWSRLVGPPFTVGSAGPACATHGACMFARLLAALALHVPTWFRGRRPHRITTEKREAGKGSEHHHVASPPVWAPRPRFRGCKNSCLRACIAQVFRPDLDQLTRTGETVSLIGVQSPKHLPVGLYNVFPEHQYIKHQYIGVYFKKKRFSRANKYLINRNSVYKKRN
jgi:hypothetical protein